MKKITLIVMALVLFATTQSKAQSAYGVAGALLSATSYTADTLTNAGTKYLTTPVFAAYFRVTEISMTLTNISGTTAATVTFEHSVDGGTTWFTLAGDSTLSFAAAGTQGFKWTDYGDNRTRIKFVGSGTQSTRISGYYRFRN